MPDEKVSQMTPLPVGLQDTDIIPAVRPGSTDNFFVTGAQIKAAAGSGGLELNDDFITTPTP